MSLSKQLKESIDAVVDASIAWSAEQMDARLKPLADAVGHFGETAIQNTSQLAMIINNIAALRAWLAEIIGNTTRWQAVVNEKLGVMDALDDRVRILDGHIIASVNLAMDRLEAIVGDTAKWRAGVNEILANIYNVFERAASTEPNHVARARKRFAVYSDFHFAGQPDDLTKLGFDTSMRAFDREMWSGAMGLPTDPPDNVALDKMAAWAISRGISKVVLDIERDDWLPTHSDNPGWVNAMNAIVHMVRQLNDSGVSVGCYGMIPEGSRTWRQIGDLSVRAKWQTNNVAMAPLIKQVDFLNPSLYDFSGNFPDWRITAESVLRECDSIAYGKPVILDVSPWLRGRVADGPIKYLDRIIDWCHDRAERIGDVSGVCVWAHGDPANPPVWDDNFSWLKAVQNAM